MIKQVGDYKLIKPLGKGSFGETYLTQKGNEPIFLATKVMERKKMEKVSTKKYLDNEIKILKQLHHPHIVRFENFLASNSNYYLIMEFCNGGDLTGCLKKYKNLYKEKTFNIEIVQYLMRQIIDALQYIHSLKIIHRDIKLDNILLSFKNDIDKQNLNMLASDIKIIDFGLSTKLDPSNLAYTVLGSPINMDPLILKKFDKAGGYQVLEGYNEKADIWSLGTVFYQLLTGVELFHVQSMKELMKKVEEGNYVIPFNNNFSKEAVSFLNCMLQYNPEERLSITELAQHDFIVKNVNEFTQADLSQIFNRLNSKGLIINTKDNKTISEVFNTSKTEGNQQLYPQQNPFKREKNIQPVMKRYNKYSTPEGYSESGNIYEPINDNNKRISLPNTNNNIIKIPININKNMNNNHRFTEGFISPGKNHNIKYEINKFEKEIKENETDENEPKEDNLIKKQKKEKEMEEIREKEKRENWDKGRKQINKYINGLLDEYKAAWEYFNKNGLQMQEEDSKIKITQLTNDLNNFEKGFSVYYDSLPKPITPEYIYNSTVEKRNSIFQLVISKYKKEKKDLEENIKTQILNYKKLDNKSFAQIKNSVMAKLKIDKGKVDKLKNIITAFEERYNNIWTPAPEISEDYEVKKSEKKSFEDSAYKLIIHTTKTNYNDCNLVLKLTMKTIENRIFNGEINIISIGDFEEDIFWYLTQKEYNNLTDNIIFIKFYSNKLYQTSLKINISVLKTEKEMNISYPILLPKQSSKTIINFNIKMISPENSKLQNETQKIINVKKVFPPFSGKSSDTNEIPSIFQNV